MGKGLVGALGSLFGLSGGLSASQKLALARSAVNSEQSVRSLNPSGSEIIVNGRPEAFSAWAPAAAAAAPAVPILAQAGRQIVVNGKSGNDFFDRLGQCLLDAGSKGVQTVIDPVGMVVTGVSAVGNAVVPTAKENTAFRDGRRQTSGRNPIMGASAGRNLPVRTLLKRAGGRLITGTAVGAGAAFIGGGLYGAFTSKNCRELVN